MPHLPILKHKGYRDDGGSAATRRAVLRRLQGLPLPSQLPPGHRVVQAAERILREARA